MNLALLCGFALLAGFIDAVVGGGGLIQIPALFILVPGSSVPLVVGTNKLSSVTGTAFATWRYARHVQLDWSLALSSAAAACAFSLLGARAVTVVNSNFLRPLVLLLLLAVAVYVFLVKDLGLVHAPRHGGRKARVLGILCGSVIGFYDGFFGPGTGSFLIFTFVGLFGFNFLAASASAKVVNLATNLAALSYFAVTNNVLWRVGLMMAVCNMAGAFVGTRLAILKGSRFVRVFFLIVVIALILRLGQQMLS